MCLPINEFVLSYSTYYNNNKYVCTMYLNTVGFNRNVICMQISV